VKIACDLCVVAAPGLGESNVGIDMRARLDADFRVHVDDVRFEVSLQRIAAAAAVDMAAAAAGLAPHAITNRIAHVQSLGLSGSLSGALSLGSLFDFVACEILQFTITLIRRFLALYRRTNSSPLYYFVILIQIRHCHSTLCYSC
jgi:hypothetical protein